MMEKSAQQDIDLAASLLDVVPKILRRIGADVPLDDNSSDGNAGLREVSELRATPGQLSLLRILVDHERCMMQELAEHLAVAPSTVTAMIKRLLTQGYVERSRDDVDWRTVWVKPTEKGRHAVDVFDNARLASLRCRLAHLSEDERESILVALPALRHLVEVR
jgi:DNA-binding MarR family transcriptional regulator